MARNLLCGSTCGAACAIGLGVFAATARATVTLPPVAITQDTFIDSSAAGDPVNGVDEQSYGDDTKVKIVAANTGNSFSGTDPSSYTHALLQIPASVFTEYATGLVTDVTVNYYPFRNAIAGGPSSSYPGNANDGDNVLELHPLTQAFTVGNGTQSPLSYSTQGGATWATYDGTNDWATPGGDYDTANFVVDDNTTQPASGGSVPFTWDITSLLANPTTAAELENNGAIIVLPDSIAQVPVGTQDFTALDSANAGSDTPFISITLVPEPASATMIGLAIGAFALRRRSRRTT